MAYNGFLKIDGVDGESQDQGHPNWIDVLSFSWGATNSAGQGNRAGRPNLSDLIIIKPLDKSSPKLALACCTGQHYKFAYLSLEESEYQDWAGQPGVKPGSGQFMAYKLWDVLVSSVQQNGSVEGDERPAEACSLNFSKIEWVYTPVNPDGTKGQSIKAGWDKRGNKKV